MVVYFAQQKHFSFLRIHVLIAVLNFCVITILSSCANEFKTIPHVHFIRLSLSGLMLRSLIHLYWVLRGVTPLELFGFFNMQLYNLTSIICWRYIIISFCFDFSPDFDASFCLFRGNWDRWFWQLSVIYVYWIQLCCCFGFSVALEPDLELTLLDQAGLELSEIRLPLPPKWWD